MQNILWNMQTFANWLQHTELILCEQQVNMNDKTIKLLCVAAKSIR